VPGDDNKLDGMTGKIVRSVLTIAIFVTLAPLFGSVFYDLSGKWQWTVYAPEIAATVPVVFVLRIFTIYTFGVLPALFVGCIVALCSPSIARIRDYIMLSTIAGAAATAVFSILYGGTTVAFWAGIGPRVVAAAAAAGGICAIVTLCFRSRPAGEKSGAAAVPSR
jgi:hypothetical protein